MQDRKAYLDDIRLRAKGKHPEMTIIQTLKKDARAFLEIPEHAQYQTVTRAKKALKKDVKRVFNDILSSNRVSDPYKYAAKPQDFAPRPEDKPGTFTFHVNYTYRGFVVVKDFYWCTQHRHKPSLPPYPFKKRRKA